MNYKLVLFSFLSMVIIQVMLLMEILHSIKFQHTTPFGLISMLLWLSKMVFLIVKVYSKNNTNITISELIESTKVHGCLLKLLISVMVSLKLLKLMSTTSILLVIAHVMIICITVPKIPLVDLKVLMI